MTASDSSRPLATRRARWLVTALLLGTAASPAAAQKDYYNTDRNRPVRIEDALGTERYALEFKVAPVRLERARGGRYHWSLHPELSYGLLPRTSIEIGIPVATVDGGSTGRRSGLAGVELSGFHRLNAETRTLPALGLRMDLRLPAGGLGPDRVRPAATAIATRTMSWARVNVNVRYGFGGVTDGDADPTEGDHDEVRWLAGVAVDRAFPLSAMLVTASLHAEQPMRTADVLSWIAGAGIRYQVSPYVAVDGGFGRDLSSSGGWYVTFGSAYHVGLRMLMPSVR